MACCSSWRQRSPPPATIAAQRPPRKPAQSTAPPPPTATDGTIPVEALPDPLPTPYLFRDEITIERPPVTEIIYEVQAGDTLASIAAQFCINQDEIQRLNNIIDIDSLSIGQEMRIPIRDDACGAAAPQTTDGDTPATPAQPAPPPGEVYIVQPGDSLSSIAVAHGLDWVELMNHNNLTEAQAANLHVGQELILPPTGAIEPAEPSEPPG